MKWQYKFLLVFFFINLCLFACVEPFDPKLNSDVRRLVIESQLTTKLDYQYVYLTYDAPYNSDVSVFKDYVADAKVVLKDNLGNEFAFFDDPTQNNTIKTPAGYNYRSVNKIQLVLGRTYQLFVETFDKKKYESLPEKVIAVPKIEKVSVVFNEIIPPAYLKTERGEFRVSVNVKDIPGEKNYYKWDWYNVKKINWCREYTVGNAAGTLSYVQPCCQDCYEKVICTNCIELENDKLIDGNSFNRNLTKIPFDNTSNYYLVINQYSLNENAYKFWNTVKEQSKTSGGLFDPTPKSIRGNFKNTNNSAEEVLGYFTVSDVHEEIVIIERNLSSPKPFFTEFYQPPFWVKLPPSQCFACNESFTRSKFAPKGWK